MRTPWYLVDEDYCQLDDVESMRALIARLRVHIAHLETEIGRKAYDELCFNQMSLFHDEVPPLQSSSDRGH